MRNRSAHATPSTAGRQDDATVDPKASQRHPASEPVFAKKQKARKRDPKQKELGLDARAVTRGAAVPAPRSGAEPGDEPLYLSLGKCCAQQSATQQPKSTTKSVKVITPCKCSCWYCDGCMFLKGLRLKRRLREALQSFTRGVFGITLTIDGTLYRSPYDAWLDVMKRRLIARLVEKLCKQNHVASRSYFWVVEFQKETKQPHWHVLVDSARIPFGVVVELWSACRPKSAPPLPFRVTAENYKQLNRPAFGSVGLSFRTAKASSAANYACKYLIKPPADGFPDWVLDHTGRVPRYGRSHGFFPPEPKADAGAEAAADAGEEQKPAKSARGFSIVHGPDCFCPDCREGTLDSRIQRRSFKTTRERRDACGDRCVLITADAVEQPDGSLKLHNRSFDRMIDAPFRAFQGELSSLGAGDHQIIREIGYDPELHRIESTYRPESDCEEGGSW